MPFQRLTDKTAFGQDKIYLVITGLIEAGVPSYQADQVCLHQVTDVNIAPDRPSVARNDDPMSSSVEKKIPRTTPGFNYSRKK